MNWLDTTIHKNTNHSNRSLVEKAYGAWLVVKCPTLDISFDYFISTLDRLYNEVHDWLIRFPKRKSQYVESGGIRMEIHRWEDGSLHARICLTTHYTID